MTDAAACYEQISDLREEMNKRFDRLDGLMITGATTMADHNARIRAIEEESDTHPALPAVPALTPAPEPTKPHWVLQALVNGMFFTLGGGLITGAVVLLQHAKAAP